VVKPLAYTRLETDDEFRDRLMPEIPGGWAQGYVKKLAGEELDKYLFDVCRQQRKIIEVYP
jgi:hypothetical protein